MKNTISFSNNLCHITHDATPKYGDIMIENNILLFLNLSNPHGAWAFDEIRRYHTRPLQFNWCPENVQFGKMHFRDPNIDARVFI